jgi:diguanylate cyclase (GGDEF)-like protein/PAS domain S-box-containing protein
MEDSGLRERSSAGRAGRVPGSLTFLPLLAFAVAYLLGAELGHLLALQTRYAEFATYWPPSGLFMAMLLACSTGRSRLAVVIAAWVANLTSDVVIHQMSVTLSLGFSAANTVEAFSGIWFIRRYRYLESDDFTVRDVIGVGLASCACSGPFAALVGGTTLWLHYGGSWIDPFRTWWLSATIGKIVFFPLCHFVIRMNWRTLGRDRWKAVEGVGALLLLCLISYLIFHVGERPLAYMIVPFSLWLAMRAETAFVVLGNVLVSVIAVYFTARNEGPLGHIEPLAFRALFVQVFSVTATLSNLSLAAAIGERRRQFRMRVESDDRFRDLFDNMTDCVIGTRLDGCILFANRAWTELSGTAAGHKVTERLHPESRELFLHVLSQLPEVEVLNGIEVKVINNQGDVLDMEASFSYRSLTADGAPQLRLLLRDVTFRKLAAQRLEHAHRQLEAANRQLEFLAATDPLTGLPNRRAFYERLKHEHASACLDETPLSLIILDVDHFKSYNDQFGHPEGDDALREIARLIRESTPHDSLPGRIGGEEFAVLLPGADEDDALKVAEHLRRSIARYSWKLRPVTASLGVSTDSCGGASQEELIEAADQALYQAKRSGRNQTVRAPALTALELAASG